MSDPELGGRLNTSRFSRQYNHHGTASWVKAVKVRRSLPAANFEEVSILAVDVQNKEMDVSRLTDEQLKNRLLRLGVRPGPIVASTRFLYEKKLQRLLNSSLQPTPTSTGGANQYSEEEDDNFGLEYARSKAVKGVEQSPLIVSRVGECSHGENYYPGCFLPTSGLHRHYDSMEDLSSEEDPSTSLDTSADRDQALGGVPNNPTLGSNVSVKLPPTLGVKPFCMSLDGGLTAKTSLPSQTFSITQLVEEEKRRNPNCSKALTKGITNAGSEQRLRSKCLVEPTRDVLTEMFPDMAHTPTGISATCRRPIKGAAGRPVQFKYRNTASSPGPKERWELQQQLVPVWVQIVVFIFVASFLYLIYGAAAGGLTNPLAALLEGWSHSRGDMEQVLPLSPCQDPVVPFLAEE
ncbi:lamina-associated polypeptide 2, isoforms beta/gamma-like [Arapaima gigas]